MPCLVRSWIGGRVAPALVACVSLFLASSVGCGSGDGAATAHLQGKVTINGQPLPADAEGTITFNTTEATQAKAVTVTLANGAYDSPSTPTGPVKVAFNITQPSGPEVTNDRGATYRESKSLVPAKYAGGMDLTVGDDNDAQDFNLEG
jgi:hypothetical protein